MVLYFFNWKVQWMLANQFKCIGNVKGSKKNGQRFPLLADHLICFPEAISFWVFVDPQKFNMFFCGSTKSQCHFLWIHILNCKPSTLFCGSTILNFYFCGSTILWLFFCGSTKVKIFSFEFGFTDWDWFLCTRGSFCNDWLYFSEKAWLDWRVALQLNVVMVSLTIVVIAMRHGRGCILFRLSLWTCHTFYTTAHRSFVEGIVCSCSAQSSCAMDCW